MKTMLVTVAALALATPALAQSDPGMLVRTPAAPVAGPAATGSLAAARAHARSIVTSPNAVYDDYGRLIGADPDPNIRSQLYRESDSIE